MKNNIQTILIYLAEKTLYIFRLNNYKLEYGFANNHIRLFAEEEEEATQRTSERAEKTHNFWAKKV